MSYAGPAASNRESSLPILLPRAIPSAIKHDSAVFAAGLAIGVVFGAGVALMLAPRSGAGTRRALARRGRRVARRGGDVWDALRETLDSVASR